jgi:hypothetical protein
MGTIQRHQLYDIDVEWKKNAKYYLIPSAQALREVVLARCPEELLSAYGAWFCAHEVWTKYSYIEIVLDIATIHGSRVSVDLRNIGSTEYPRWQILGYRQSKWVRVEIPDAELRAYLENIRDKGWE